jgi:hypothetical protein
LSDLEQCAADLIAVADANGIVGQSFDREVLAELSVDEVGPLQPLLPVAIRFDLVDKGGSLLTPVAGQVAFCLRPGSTGRPDSGHATLMKAVSDNSALLIVGDIDQLPSVGPGPSAGRCHLIAEPLESW